MSPRPVAVRIALLPVVALALAACDASAPTSATRANDARASLLTAAATPILALLYQQTTTEGYVRLCFEGFTCADDFVVPIGETWTVTDVALTGTGGGNAAVPTQVQFYRDVGGLPGALLQSFSVPPTSVTPEVPPFISNYFRALPAPLVLTAGTYWIAARDFGWAVVKPPVNNWASGKFGADPWFRFPEEDFAFRLYTGQTPNGSIEALRLTVAGIGLPQGIANSVDAKLQAALLALASDDRETACDALQALLNHVRAQRTKHIPAGDADAINAAVTAVRSEIGCV
jgi:hypothetical protein